MALLPTENKSITKSELKTSIVESLYYDILSNANTYYYFVGKSTQFNAENSLEQPISAISYESRVRDEIISLKKITGSDVSPVVPRYNWISGEVFDMYDDLIGKSYDLSIVPTLTGDNRLQGNFDPSLYGVNWNVSGYGIEPGTYITNIIPGQEGFPDEIYLNKSVNATARAISTINSNGQVTSVQIVWGGAGYSTTPTVTFSNPPVESTIGNQQPRRATGQAILNSFGEVSQILITDGGSGYVVAPSVTISGGSIDKVTITKLSASGADSLDQSKFYCLTSERNVYKCLYNNNGTPSTVKPFATTHEPIETSDGYIWKYMYSIPGSSVNKFMTNSVMPVTTSNRSDYYSKGSINSATIINRGSGYTAGLTQLIVTGNGSQAENQFKFTNVVIVNAGSGYTSAPTVTVRDPFETVIWEAEAFYLSGQYLKVNSRIYLVNQGGITSTSAPTHTGDFPIKNGTTVLKFVGFTPSITTTISNGSVNTATMKGIIGNINLTNVGSNYNQLTITNATWSSNTVTITTAETHNLIQNSVVVIQNVISNTNQTGSFWVGYNGRFTVTSVNANNKTFTYTLNTNPGTYSSGGNAEKPPPEVTIAGGSGSGATAVSTLSANGYVSNILLTNRGQNYTNTPPVTVSVGGNAAATAEVLYGFGYFFIPPVTVSDPIVFTSNNNIAWESLGEVTASSINKFIKVGFKFYKILSIKNNANSGNFDVFPPIHSGTSFNGDIELQFVAETARIEFVTTRMQARLVPVIENGEIVNVISQDPGINYSIASIDVFPPNLGAEITPNISSGDLNTRQATVEDLAIPGSIETVEILSSGSNYSGATILIEGDGIGCTASPIIENGRIVKIKIETSGINYTYANVIIQGISAPNITIVPAHARAIISPYIGHGKNAPRELFAKELVISTTLGTERNQGFIIDNDYRQSGIIKNIRAFGGQRRANSRLETACYVITGNFEYDKMDLDKELFYTASNGQVFKYRIIAKPQTPPANSTTLGLPPQVSLLVQALNNRGLELNDILMYKDGETEKYAGVGTILYPTIDKYSGDMLYIDNRPAYESTDDQTLSFKTVIKL